MSSPEVELALSEPHPTHQEFSLSPVPSNHPLLPAAPPLHPSAPAALDGRSSGPTHTVETQPAPFSPSPPSGTSCASTYGRCAHPHLRFCQIGRASCRER